MTIKNDADQVSQMKGGDRRMDYEEELETKGYIDCLLHELHEQPQLIRQTNIEEVVERTKEEIIRDGFHGYELRRHVFRMILRIDFILTTESVRLSQEGRDAIDELRRKILVAFCESGVFWRSDFNIICNKLRPRNAC